MSRRLTRAFVLWPILAVLAAAAPEAGGPVKHLFSERGVPADWLARAWDDIHNAAPDGAKWEVDGRGILHGSEPRGTWLISKAEYANFELNLDFKIPPRGNSGVALRCPLTGDPAYEGMELQIVDPRYYDNKGDPDQLTGSLYKAVAPMKQAFKPEAWNHYRITCRGPRVKVVLNDTLVQDVNLDEQTKPLERGKPLKERPRRGHIGFQELSRGGHVQIRNVTLRVLTGGR
ncbi:MAG TPA: DUF1080 domain-containing protein [Tepidisphaeraceae bacterium]|nr:DUF1080 domain-containing protein [Tepidisphaeraceae bacterium]